MTKAYDTQTLTRRICDSAELKTDASWSYEHRRSCADLLVFSVLLFSKLFLRNRKLQDSFSKYFTIIDTKFAPKPLTIIYMSNELSANGFRWSSRCYSQ